MLKYTRGNRFFDVNLSSRDEVLEMQTDRVSDFDVGELILDKVFLSHDQVCNNCPLIIP